MRYFLSNLQDPLGRIYECEELPIHGSMGTKAFRIFRPDKAEHYDVRMDAYGSLLCSCPDYECRKKGTALLCKHGQALVDAGLMPKPDPRPNY